MGYIYYIFHPIDEQVKNTACPQQGNSNEHAHQVRDNFHTSAESLFCALYKSLKNVDFFINPSQHDEEKYQKNQSVGNQFAHRVQLLPA